MAGRRRPGPCSWPSRACSGGGGGQRADDVRAPERRTPARPCGATSTARSAIGVWLPTSGPAAALGSPLAAGVELAVQEINEAGGVNGRMVQVANRDEGGDPATAYQALRRAAGAGAGGRHRRAGVVPGGAGAIDTLAAAHVVDCSPTATAIDLGGRRDNGYFVRTIGSDALEAVALTKAMIATGRTAFVVLYPDDDYGLAFANEVQRSFRRLRESVTARPLRPDRRALQRPRRAGAGRRGRGHRRGRDGPDRRQRPRRPRAERRRPAADVRVRDRRPPPGRPGDA